VSQQSARAGPAPDPKREPHLQEPEAPWPRAAERDDDAGVRATGSGRGVAAAASCVALAGSGRGVAAAASSVALAAASVRPERDGAGCGAAGGGTATATFGAGAAGGASAGAAASAASAAASATTSA